jgi:hypothetical protein
MKLLNGRKLAKAMGVSKLYVTAMRAPVSKGGGGYVFQYGRQTTLSHALAWREQNPDFVSTEYVEQTRGRSEEEKTPALQAKGRRSVRPPRRSCPRFQGARR